MFYIYLTMIENSDDIMKFTEIHSKYKGLMHYIAFSILKNKQDAEDAVQEAFFKLARNIHKVEEISAKKTESFLVILVRNTAIDIYRARQQEQGKTELNDENDMDIIESTDSMDVLSGIISTAGYRKLVELIEGLSDTYKDAMKLRFVFEWTNGEIAELLGISKGAVEFRINRGRVLLIELLRKEGCYDILRQKRS